MSSERTLSEVVIALLRGPLYRDQAERQWYGLLEQRAAVGDHVAVLGLDVVVDENQGFAFLRSAPVLEGVDPLPRLVQRRTLSFPLSLLLALLRGRLAEHDSSTGASLPVVSRDQIVEMLRSFLPEASHDARIVDQVDSHIAKAIELGFLRRVKGDEGVFEIRRILAAFVDGQWLSEFETKLSQYAAHTRGES